MQDNKQEWSLADLDVPIEVACVSAVPTARGHGKAKAPAQVYDNPGHISARTRHDDRVWYPPAGPKTASVVFVCMLPQIRANQVGTADHLYAGPQIHKWLNFLRSCRVDVSNVLFTSVIRYAVRGDKFTKHDVLRCLPLLYDEIRGCKPRLVIAVGADALKTLCGRKRKITGLSGSLVPMTDHPEFQVMPIMDLGYLAYDPSAEFGLKKALSQAARIQRGEAMEVPSVETTMVRTPEDAFAMWQALMSAPERTIAVDCEWHGDHWADPHGWLRLVQLSVRPDHAYVVELAGVGVPNESGAIVPSYRPDPVLGAAVRRILEDDGTSIIGHNAIADGEWLRRDLGAEIRHKVTYDTMLAEHLLDSDGTFDLTTLVTKYTPCGPYDAALEVWKADNMSLWHGGPGRSGYGAVPTELLAPYAALDAAKTLHIVTDQKPRLEKFGYFNKRGRYPSVHEADLGAQAALYDVQQTGILVDKERLAYLTDVYNTKKDELHEKLMDMAAQLGMPEFNPESGDDVRVILFDKLGITPIRATGAHDNMPWYKVLEQEEDFQADVRAAADKRTLDILQDKHPFAKTMRQYRTLAQACKVWLSRDHSKGLWQHIWPDGRLHPSFSMLKKTNRFGSSDPNVQNFPKRAEGDLKVIFEDALPPPIRSIFIAPPGKVIVEADWKQAELFVLAGLSGDRTMMGALVTPGQDLHDMTAVSSFGLKMIDPDGNVVSDTDLVALAATAGVKAYEKKLKTLRYVDARGGILDRAQFKATLRVGAKNLNFGIPYGRGALDIAIQVKGETGSKRDIDDIAAEIQQMMDTWKGKTYRDAWEYMQGCASSVTDPGYIETPWGTRRIFQQTHDQRVLSGMRREAQNFPVQGTVAETCKIALCDMSRRQRMEPGRFNIMNQIHDAIQILVREDDVEYGERVCRETMGEIDIPMPGKPLRLDVDVEHFTRWGEASE